MAREKLRYGQDPWTVVRSADKTFRLPLTLAAGQRVFVCSWSDFWHERADEWRGEAWEIMRQRPDLTFIVPTKRPERMRPERFPRDWRQGWPHVWGLVSVESQGHTDRIDRLLGVPFRVRGVSAEPLLGALDLSQWLIDNGPHWWRNGVDWVIAGGESGPDARLMHPEWAWHLQRQCEAGCVAFFFKQWGEWSAVGWRYEPWLEGDVWLWPDGRTQRCSGTVPGGNPEEPLDEMVVEDGLALMRRRGRRESGRSLYGYEWSEFPG